MRIRQMSAVNQQQSFVILSVDWMLSAYSITPPSAFEARYQPVDATPGNKEESNEKVPVVIL